MSTFRGLVYVKFGRVGTKSEGPDYYLQTRKGDFLLQYKERILWQPDYELEFYCRKMVEIEGELGIGGMILKVESIIESKEIGIPPSQEGL